MIAGAAPSWRTHVQIASRDRHTDLPKWDCLTNAIVSLKTSGKTTKIPIHTAHLWCRNSSMATSVQTQYAFISPRLSERPSRNIAAQFHLFPRWAVQHCHTMTTQLTYRAASLQRRDIGGQKLISSISWRRGTLLLPL